MRHRLESFARADILPHYEHYLNTAPKGIAERYLASIEEPSEKYSTLPEWAHPSTAGTPVWLDCEAGRSKTSRKFASTTSPTRTPSW